MSRKILGCFNVTILSDEMRQIIERLRLGVSLIGPVTVPRPTGHAHRPWGFSDGRRANKISVDALAARGLIVIRDYGNQREAILAKEADRLLKATAKGDSPVAEGQAVGALRACHQAQLDSG